MEKRKICDLTILIAINLFSLIGILFLNWNIKSLIFLFGVEFLAILYMQFFIIISTKRKKGISISSKIKTSISYLIAIIIVTLFGSIPILKLLQPNQGIIQALNMLLRNKVWLGVVLIILSYIISLFLQIIKKDERPSKKEREEKWKMINHILTFIWSIAIAFLFLEIIHAVEVYNRTTYESSVTIITKIMGSLIIMIKSGLDLRLILKKDKNK